MLHCTFSVHVLCHQGHLEVFSDDMLAPYLQELSITTDEERIQAVSLEFVFLGFC